MDELRSACARREVYVGPWLPEPLITTGRADLTDNVVLRESLSFAFLLMLEKLSPLERAVLVLREVFDYDSAEIAAIVDKSVANCRQVFLRARRRLAVDETRRRHLLEVAEKAARDTVTRDDWAESSPRSCPRCMANRMPWCCSRCAKVRSRSCTRWSTRTSCALSCPDDHGTPALRLSCCDPDCLWRWLVVSSFWLWWAPAPLRTWCRSRHPRLSRCLTRNERFPTSRLWYEPRTWWW